MVFCFCFLFMISLTLSWWKDLILLSHFEGNKTFLQTGLTVGGLAEMNLVSEIKCWAYQFRRNQYKNTGQLRQIIYKPLNIQRILLLRPISFFWFQFLVDMDSIKSETQIKHFR